MACYNHLLLSKDKTSMVSVALNKAFQVKEVVGDTKGLVIKVGAPWGPVVMMAESTGWTWLPNQWETKTVFYKKINEEGTLYRLSVNAKHSTKRKISITYIGGPTLQDAKTEFWKKWNNEVPSTGWARHLVKTGADYTDEDKKS